MTPEVIAWYSDVAKEYFSSKAKILDVGSLDMNGNLRDVSECSEYIGIDIKDGSNVDHVLHSHNLLEHFGEKVFDVVSCSSMLNNDSEFWLTIENMKSVLKDNGLLAIAVPGINFLNSENHPTDYYRFTIDVFKDMFFKGMEIEDIQNVYDDNNLCTIVGAATKFKKKRYKTNLIYYIAPFAGEMWKWNIKELARYINVFNNKKIVFIATRDGFDSPEDVQEEFSKNNIQNIDYHIVENDADLGECASLYKMFDLVYSLDKEEYTFFAHAKGVTREVERKKSWCSLEANKTWIKKMFAYNLMSSNKIHRILSDKPCFGIMKSSFTNKKLRWYFVDSKYMWVYAGGFFWFNNYRLFSEDFNSIKFKKRYTIESYLSNFFIQEEAGSELSGMGDVVNFSNSPFRESTWYRWIKEGLV